MAEETAALRELLALYRQQRDAPGEEDGSLLISSSAEGFNAVRRIGGDALQRLLADRLARQVDVGQSLYQDHEFLDVLQAALWALHAPPNVREGEELRVKVFVSVLQGIHSQNVPPGVAATVSDVLLRELQHLHDDDLPLIMDELLRGVTIGQQSQRQRRPDGLAIFYSIELLPQLLMRIATCALVILPDGVYDFPERCSGTEYRDQIMRKLVALAWPKRFFLQFLKTIREFPLTEAQEHEVCSKIFREANSEISARSAGGRVNNFELLPTIFHNVLLLALRMKSVVCKRIFIHMLVQQCGMLASETSARPDCNADSSSSAVSRSFSMREIRALQSTILYHLDIILKQDPTIGKLFLVEYEGRVSTLSSFDVAVLLTISSGPHGARVTSFLLQRVIESYTKELTEGHSPASSTRGAILQAIPDAVDGCWSSISPRIVSFGLHLIEAQDKKTEVLLENAATGQKSMHLPWIGFGIRMMIDCFRLDESVRERIIDNAMNGAIVQNDGTKAALLLLARIVQRHAVDLNGALCVRVREGFEYLIHMTPKNARLFLYALGPLLKARPNMKGFLILTLRKAMFRKDEASRIIGIQGFSFLLCLFSQVFKRGTLTQLYSQNTGVLLSQGIRGSTQVALSAAVESQSEIATQEQSTAIVAEDLFRQFCGIFKRTFQLQTSVRLVLYAELLRVFRECPSLQPPILELVFRHFSKYYDANESTLPPLKLDSCSGAQRRGAYDEPLAYLLHTLIVCVEVTRLEGAADQDTLMGDGLLPATQTPAAQQSFGTIDRCISVLMERMKRCEISDFDLDKNVSFAPQYTHGLDNRQLGRMLCEVLETCMDWLIVSAAPSGGLDQSAWAGLAHYLHLHQWITARLGDGDGEGLPNDTSSKIGRKRGRPAGKTKQRSAIDGDKQPECASATGPSTVDNGIMFREHAVVKDAHLLTSLSIVVFMDAAAKKLEQDAFSLTKDEEHLLLFVASRASSAVGFVQETSVGDFQLLARGTSLSSDSKIFVDHLGPALFTVAKSLQDAARQGGLHEGATSTIDRERLERLRKIRSTCLRTVGVIVELWMTRSMEEATDCIAGIFRESSGGADAGRSDDDEDDFGGVSCSDRLQKHTLQLCTLFDSLVGKEMADEASAVLDIIKTIWSKLSSVALGRFEIWMKSALTRRRFASQKLLEKMVLLFLRPQVQQNMNFSMALQMATGLFHNCNEEGEIAFPIDSVNFDDRLNLDMLDEKNVATVAGAILAKAEQAMGDLEPRVKALCAQQLRLELKLKEEEADLLQTFEDENGFSALDMKNAAVHFHAAFKSYCRQVYDLAGLLMPFAMINLSKAALSLRVIRLIGRLYKILTSLITCKLRRKESTLPRYLQRLFDRTASELAPILLQFIACIHEEAKRQTTTKASKTRKSASVPTAAQSKLIPDVIYQMEQFDLILIKLSKLCKERDFSAWSKLRQARDFRFNQKGIHKQINESRMDKGHQEDDGDDDNDDNDASAQAIGAAAGFDDERGMDLGAEATESAEYEEEGEEDEEDAEEADDQDYDQPQDKRTRRSRAA